MKASPACERPSYIQDIYAYLQRPNFHGLKSAGGHFPRQRYPRDS